MRNLLLITLILFFSCKNEENFRFVDVKCSVGKMPEFDGNVVSLLDDNGVALKDTMISKIEKRRTVFKPCRDYVYSAIFKEKNGDIITDSRIKMTAIGERWEFHPTKQDAIIIQYEYSSSDEEKSKNHKLNKTLPDHWVSKTQTGIIENVEEIWMHPFRSNQFAFTEVAPFPKVDLPLEIDKTWFSQLNIQQGWGDWENTSGNMSYKVVSLESIETRYGLIENCWKIESYSSYPFGKSYFDYWFNENLGFVRMKYKNYGGQTLDIELEKVIDR